MSEEDVLSDGGPDEGQMAAWIDAAFVAMLVAYRAGRIVVANRAACDLFGHFYDLFRFPDGRVGLVVGDASGHGFAAALVTATARSYLRALVRTEGDLGAVLRTLNDLLGSRVEAPVGELVTQLFDAVAAFRGAGDPHDDATAVLARLRSA